MTDQLFHCFGQARDRHVDTELVLAMLAASGSSHLAVNTHNLGAIDTGGHLPVGYGSATFGSVMARLGERNRVTAVLNINHALTAAEAVDRARRAVELTGLKTIKLEVLSSDLTETRTVDVVRAAEALVGDGLAVWPLLTADVGAARECQAMGCPTIRIMGSPIGSLAGIDPCCDRSLSAILDEKVVPAMLDGGVGTVAHLADAFGRGFDSVLVNSCLFEPPPDPVARLQAFRAAIHALAPAPLAGERSS